MSRDKEYQHEELTMSSRRPDDDDDAVEAPGGCDNPMEEKGGWDMPPMAIGEGPKLIMGLRFGGTRGGGPSIFHDKLMTTTFTTGNSYEGNRPMRQ